MVKFKIEFENGNETRTLSIGDKDFSWTLRLIPNKQMKLNGNEIAEIDGESDDYTFETQIWKYNQDWCEDDNIYESFIVLDESDDIEEIQEAMKMLQTLDR